MYKLVAALVLCALPAAAQTRSAGPKAENDSVAVIVDVFTAANSARFDPAHPPRLVISVMDGYSVRALPPITSPFTPGSSATLTVKMPSELDTVKAISVDYDPRDSKHADWIYSRIVVRRGKFPPVVCGAKEGEENRRFNAIISRTTVC